MTTGLLHGIVANSKTRVRCVFCGVYIPKANKCIEEHRNGTKHRGNMIRMTQNGMSFINDDLYCKPCNVYLTDDESVASHLEADDHANWMADMFYLTEGEFIHMDPYLTSDSNDVFCRVCDVKINCTLQNIESHVNDIVHHSNVVEYLKSLNAISPNEDDGVWCKVCEEYIEYDTRSILDHNNQHHVEWLTEFEGFIEGQDISIQEFLNEEYGG